MCRKAFQICTRCVMDTTDPDIEFDSDGICNHCKQYYSCAANLLFSGKEGEARLQQIAGEIKKHGKAKEYDCILGLSGGVDSSFVAYHAKRLGLRPLAVHLDNGWDTEVAIRNIENIVEKLDLHLYTYRTNWEEFRDLQLSFLKASVIDIEMLTDHAIKATLFNVAKEKRIKYILGGENLVSEGILPKAWRYDKGDIKNIKAIHDRFGQKRISTFPIHGLFREVITRRIRNIHQINILNYVRYNKQEGIKTLEREFDWRNYGGKHCESIFTRFYQKFVLPQKFNVDKRKAHLSTLICSGQITRWEALQELNKALYEPKELQEETEYVLSKLGLSEEEFSRIMNLPVRSHLDYPNGQWQYKQLRRVTKPLRLGRSAIRRLRA